MAVAMIALLLIALQITASNVGFRGPLHSLISDYVATPQSATVPWVGLGLAMVGLSNRSRIIALSVAAALDVVFAAARLLRGGLFALGNGPLIVLTGLAVVLVWRRWARDERTTALRGVAFGFLLIIATKGGDAWLRITAIFRPKVLDEYALLADHALAQPSWLLGGLVHAGGPSSERGAALGVHRAARCGSGGRGLPAAQRPHRRLAAPLSGADVPGARPDRTADLYVVPTGRPRFRVRQWGAGLPGRRLLAARLAAQ